MSTKTIGLIVSIVGLLVALFFVLADVIGVGNPPFGLRQIIGTVVGALILVGGIIVFLTTGQKEEGATE